MELSVKITLSENQIIEIDSFKLANRKINFIFGESGIGKTLISQAILGILPKDEFKIEIDGVEYAQYLELPGVKEIMQKHFFVFQEPSSHLSQTQTLREQISEGCFSETPRKEEFAKSLFYDKSVAEIEKLLNTYPKSYRPSGGEKQRIFNLMSFLKIQNLTISTAWNGYFFFDEPTGFLDVKTRNILIKQMVESYIIDKPTFLIITHDYSIISFIKEQFSEYSELFSYTEIYKDGENLKQRTFDEFEYLFWLENAVKNRPNKVKQSEVVMELQSGISIFGKKLNFYRNEYSSESTKLTLRKGEITYLKAASGVGKTTIAKIIMGLIHTKFNMNLDGKHITEKTPILYFKNHLWGKKLSMVFQNADESLNPKTTVKNLFNDFPRKIEKTLLQNYFERLFPKYDFSELLDRKVGTLSGGEKQKINLIRALILETEITILDEPITGSDLSGIKQILIFLQEQIAFGKSFLLISHNEDIFDTIVPPENVYYLR